MAGLLIVALVAAQVDRGNPASLSIYALGLVGGATIALQAIGIVLVYRSSRIINFAQVQMGTTAGLVLVHLVIDRTILRAMLSVCPGCIDKPSSLGEFLERGGASTFGSLAKDPTFQRTFGADTPLDDPALLDYFPRGFTTADFTVGVAPQWMVAVNYILAALFAIALSMFLVWVVYALVLKRFGTAPKLVLTVITIAAGFAVQQASDPVLSFLFGSGGDGEGAAAPGTARLPVDAGFTWAPVVFSAADVLTVVVACAAAIGLTVFFRRSRTGLALRGAAENAPRAQTLGVNVDAVTARAWLLAGALSGVAAVLAVARTGAAPQADNYDVFVRTLTAAAAGGLVNLPLTAIGGLVLGVADQSFAWVFGSQALLAALLLAMVVTLLMVQRARESRADRDAGASWQASRELRPIPLELRGVPAVRLTRRAGAVVLLGLVLGYPWFMSPSQINLGLATMAAAMIGLSLLILTGWAGQISLGHMAFAAVGGWVAGSLEWPFLLALAAGGVAGMLVAVVVGIPSLKLRGLHLAISTLAFGVAAAAVLFDPTLLGRYLGTGLDRPLLLGLDFEDDRSFYYLVLLLLAATVAGTVGLRRSAVARTLIAAKDNELAAMNFGINLLRARVVAFAVSGFIAAVAGVLLAYAQHRVDPLAFTAEAGVSVFLMTLLGGVGSVIGPLLGAVYLGILRIMSTSDFRAIAEILLNPGLGVILLLTVLPGGLAQGVHQARDAWLRRVAARNRIEVPSLLPPGGGRHGLVPVQPKQRPTGGEAFVPIRFRLDGQWLAGSKRPAEEQERVRG